MIAELTYDQLQNRDDIVWIDVRSETEFAESRIPQAIHVPLFSDAERAEIGTVYKQVNPARAREVGLTIAAEKLPLLYRRIAAISAEGIPVVYCWRGGMRSKTVATVLDLMGIPVIRLVGGYRAYRQHVTERLSAMAAEDLPRIIVIHGMTGVGKTLLLHYLDQELGEPVLDLEAYAGHRGSVFGGIGLEVANQRQFDSALYAALVRHEQAPYLLLEAESKRIGRVSLPEFLHTAKLNGYNIEITASVATRVKRTLAQYRLDDEQAFTEEISRSIAMIEKRFSPDLRKRVKEWMAAGQYEEMVAALLVEYYDPRYRHAMAQYGREFRRIDGENLADAGREIRALLRSGYLQ